MNWIQWRLNINSEVTEPLEALLLNSGAVSITYQDGADRPVYEPGPGEVLMWDDLLLVALFEADVDTRAVETQLSALPVWEGVSKSHWEVLEDKDWVRAWMDDYKPMKFGDNLWICPTWCEPPEPGATNLMLDPGLAFGSGTHPTTTLCLTYLSDHIKGGETVTDFGCGSGILALAAAKLGAKQVIGVDHDPQAIIASKENADRNDIAEGHISVYTNDNFNPNPTDGVIANILARTLNELVDEIVNLVKPGGWIALSGILESQVKSVQEKYSPWIIFDEPVVLDEWVLLSGIKKP